MNRLLIHFVEGEDISSVLHRVEQAILMGAVTGKNSAFNFTLDSFEVKKQAKKKARVLTYQDIKHLTCDQINASLSDKDILQGLDRIEAELLLSQYAEDMSDKDIVIRAVIENKLTELFKH